MPTNFFMPTEIVLQYYNSGLAIGLENIRTAWYVPTNFPPLKLTTVVYQGLLTYRFPHTGKRISYRQLKKGLTKKAVRIVVPLALLPF